MAVVLNNPAVGHFTTPKRPPRQLHCATRLGADTRGAGPGDAGEILAYRVIGMMKATGMQNGLSAAVFGEDPIDALANGAEPPHGEIRNAPVDVGRDALKALFRSAFRYW
jgi:alcohol dehydrogenase class IV